MQPTTVTLSCLQLHRCCVSQCIFGWTSGICINYGLLTANNLKLSIKCTFENTCKTVYISSLDPILTHHLYLGRSWRTFVVASLQSVWIWSLVTVPHHFRQNTSSWIQMLAKCNWSSGILPSLAWRSAYEIFSKVKQLMEVQDDQPMELCNIQVTSSKCVLLCHSMVIGVSLSEPHTSMHDFIAPVHVYVRLPAWTDHLV